MAPVLLWLLALVAGGPAGAQPPLPAASEPACPVCVWRRHSKELRLESIKSQILSKLRLKEAPNITREVVKQLLPKAPPLQQILDLHDFQGDSLQHDEYLEEDEYHATTETVISMAQETDPVVQIEGNPHCCFFNFSPKIMFTKVVKAQLWVYLRPVQHTSTVYLQILRPGSVGMVLVPWGWFCIHGEKVLASWGWLWIHKIGPGSMGMVLDP
uniref:Growth differentiation factor 11 n=1 Tax=Phasianus colchicus TaxID=9054 RepID=A0A669QIH2_PHACC